MNRGVTVMVGRQATRNRRMGVMASNSNSNNKHGTVIKAMVVESKVTAMVVLVGARVEAVTMTHNTVVRI